MFHYYFTTNMFHSPHTFQLTLFQLLHFLTIHSLTLNERNNGPLSARWAPDKIHTCLPDAPETSAPCISKKFGISNFITAYDIVYKGFRVREPLFAHYTHREHWLGMKENSRFQLVEGENENATVWGEYQQFVGSNFVIRNGTWSGKPAMEWGQTSCMDGYQFPQKRIRIIQELLSGSQADGEFGEFGSLVFVATPDYWSFQHFLDRSTRVFIQAMELIMENTDVKVLNGHRSRMQKRVLDIWEILGVDSDKMVYVSDFVGKNGIRAQRYIDSCHSILIHPYQSLRQMELMGTVNEIPIQQKKFVLFMSRQVGGVHNGGRRIMNSKKLIFALEELLQRRGKGEQLRIFRDGDFSTRELIDWMSKNVAAVIGPHGGALYNHHFLGKDTIVYELSAYSRRSPMFWEESSLLGQKYIFTPCKQINKQEDMIAPVYTITKMLDKHLGVPIEADKPILQPLQTWPVK